MAKQVVSIKLHPERLARLDAMATDLGITRTAAVEAALDAWTDPPVVTIVNSVQAAPDVDPDQILLDLAAQPPSNPWGI